MVAVFPLHLIRIMFRVKHTDHPLKPGTASSLPHDGSAFHRFGTQVPAGIQARIIGPPRSAYRYLCIHICDYLYKCIHVCAADTHTRTYLKIYKWICTCRTLFFESHGIYALMQTDVTYMWHIYRRRWYTEAMTAYMRSYRGAYLRCIIQAECGTLNVVSASVCHAQGPPRVPRASWSRYLHHRSVP